MEDSLKIPRELFEKLIINTEELYIGRRLINSLKNDISYKNANITELNSCVAIQKDIIKEKDKFIKSQSDRLSKSVPKNKVLPIVGGAAILGLIVGLLVN